ncbi:RNA-binding protein Hfq [Natranaerovirga pectinivora]|uniref:RNA-binding protein Hfq n=1 Tax=Natranaerovirga pectinivora TaxID=682400 RepID=A0A4R3MPT1_9FIRM|nr:RNA chaperone Hfq [Natranaerovirga pectinivora]TCT14992.1 RNA-binding protein Hfq [Natranaerovirga pectinivora]
MSKAINLQDLFLNQVRKEKVALIVYLTNGFQLKGTVKGFDNFIVILEVEGKTQMIYKHAISTIIPTVEVNFNAATMDANN